MGEHISCIHEANVINCGICTVKSRVEAWDTKTYKSIQDQEKWFAWAEQQPWPVKCDKCDLILAKGIKPGLLWSQHFAYHQPMPNNDTSGSAGEPSTTWLLIRNAILLTDNSVEAANDIEKIFNNFAAEQTRQELVALREHRTLVVASGEEAVPLAVINQRISELEGNA